VTLYPRVTVSFVPTDEVTEAQFQEMLAQVGTAHGWARVSEPIERNSLVRGDNSLLRVRHCWWSDLMKSWMIEFEYAREK
jgi:hypothetical protein